MKDRSPLISPINLDFVRRDFAPLEVIGNRVQAKNSIKRSFSYSFEKNTINSNSLSQHQDIEEEFFVDKPKFLNRSLSFDNSLINSTINTQDNKRQKMLGSIDIEFFTIDKGQEQCLTPPITLKAEEINFDTQWNAIKQYQTDISKSKENTSSPVKIKSKTTSIINLRGDMKDASSILSNKEKKKILADVDVNYSSGLENYIKCNFKEAEKYFIKILKPVLGKPEIRNLYIDVRDIKQEVLYSMFYLGKIYSKDASYSNHYAKAAAIFQYCYNFAKKYDVAIEVEPKESGVIDSPDYFLDLAYRVERQFLQELGKDIASYDKEKQKKKIQEYKKDLNDLRIVIKQKLDNISSLSISEIKTRTEQIEHLCQETTNFFVDNKSNAQRGFIQKLLSDCFEQLGPPPKECEYAVIGFGSLAMGSMTPWSDLEFGILINDDKYTEYFRNLTKLLHIKIVHLGETHLHSMGIESFNNFKTGYEQDDWFEDNIIKSGFKFDGSHWFASKTPLGREGYKARIKKKDNNGLEKKIIVDKPNYELILTPKQMANFQSDKHYNDINKKNWFSSDRHLVQGIRSPILINGSSKAQELIDKYRVEIKGAVSDEIAKARSLDLLLTDLSKFCLKLGDKEEGKLLDVKQDIYRLADRIVSALANYYGIQAEECSAGINVWQMVDKMQENGKVSLEGAKHLKEALSIATELRLNAYCYNNGQKNVISTYLPTVTKHLSAEQENILKKETFYIKDTHILHHFYYIMLRVQNLVQKFCNEGIKNSNEIALQGDSLYIASNYNKGMVYARFVEYDLAIEFLEKERTQNPNDLELLGNLYSLYIKLGSGDNAVNIAKQMSILINVKHPKNQNHIDIIAIYSKCAVAYDLQGNTKQAMHYHNLVLNSLDKIDFCKQNEALSSIYNNLAITYAKKGQTGKAIMYYLKALNNKLKPYIKTDLIPKTDEPKIDFKNTQIYDERISNYHKTALQIWEKSNYQDEYDYKSLANIYNNLGAAYHDKKNYNLAIEYYNQSLKIRLKIYNNRPNHHDIIESYNNLGCVYQDNKNYNEAIDCYKHAFYMAKQLYKYSADQHIVREVKNNLANAVVNVGNILLLDDKEHDARSYYSIINTSYQSVSLKSKMFVELIKKYTHIAYKNNSIEEAINGYKLLLLCDPQLCYGNDYHAKLANLHAALGKDYLVSHNLLLETNELFLNALAKRSTPALQIQYAQFLIMNKDFFNETNVVSYYLYSAASVADKCDSIQYTEIDKKAVCADLWNIIKHKNSAILVDAKLLIYFLLQKNPEYQLLTDKHIKLFKSLEVYGQSLTNDVSLNLLAYIKDEILLLNSPDDISTQDYNQEIIGVDFISPSQPDSMDSLWS